MAVIAVNLVFAFHVDMEVHPEDLPTAGLKAIAQVVEGIQLKLGDNVTVINVSEESSVHTL